jgi:hypothetical protein
MDESSGMRHLYIAMAAIGGAIISLSQLRWQDMPWQDRGMTLLVGVLFSLFGVPWVVGDLMNVDITPLRVACGVTFFGAAGAPIFVPMIIRFFRKKFGTTGDFK